MVLQQTVDPDQRLHFVVLAQGLHCLHLNQELVKSNDNNNRVANDRFLENIFSSCGLGSS